MERYAAGNIGVACNKSNQRPYLRLARREWARADLVCLLAPVSGEIAVEVKSFFVWLDFDSHSIPVFQRSLGQKSVVSPARFRRVTPNQESLLVRMRLPC